MNYFILPSSIWNAYDSRNLPEQSDFENLFYDDHKLLHSTEMTNTKKISFNESPFDLLTFCSLAAKDFLQITQMNLILSDVLFKMFH